MPSTLEASTNRMGLLVGEGWVSPRRSKVCEAIAGGLACENISGKKVKLD